MPAVTSTVPPGTASACSLAILPKGQVATFAHTANTNYCAVGLTFVPDTSTLIVTSSIDNLGLGRMSTLCDQLEVLGREDHVDRAQTVLLLLNQEFERACALLREERTRYDTASRRS